MDKQTAYKLDSKGKTRIWSIWVSKNPDGTANMEIESGLLDGKKVRETIHIKVGKNLEKSNATTPYTQAVAEAEAKLELKLRGEYVTDISQVSQGVLRSGISAPMLAQKYHPTGAQKSSKTLDKMKIKGQKIHVQPKYDGNRRLVKIDGDTLEGYTRKGDIARSVPHIEKQLRESYDRIYSGTEKRELVLDGELYSTEISFNTLNGLLRKEKWTPEEEAQVLTIDYRLYDVMVGENYAMRHELIKPFASEDVLVVPSYEIVATDESIKKYLEQFLEQGEEGLIIRTLDKGYENKRSWQLVKVKVFEDAEFEIVGMEEDVKGNLGKIICKMEEPSTDRDGNTITTFKAGTSGTSHEEGKEILKNKADYIGKMATIEFFGRSEYSVPRFPKYKGLRKD